MKKQLKILLVSESLFTLSAGLLLPIYAVFVEGIGGDILDASVTFAVFSITIGVILFTISKWEDHVRHAEKLIIIGYSIGLLGVIGYFFVSSPWHLLVIQFILGIGVAIRIPVWDALYSRFLDERKYASEWGLYETSDYIVTGIGALVGGIIATYLGFNFIFLFMIILSFIGLSTSLYLIREIRIFEGLKLVNKSIALKF